MAVIGASIVLVLVNVSLSDLRTASVSESRAQARSSAEAAIDSYLAHISATPNGFLTEVHELERTRVCLADDSPVPPGSPWPAECGGYWTYTDPTTGPVEEQAEAALEVLPPGPGRPNLQITAVGRYGREHVALTATVARRTLSDWNLVTFDTGRPLALGDATDSSRINTPAADSAFWAAGGFNLGANVPRGIYATSASMPGAVPGGSVVADANGLWVDSDGDGTLEASEEVPGRDVTNAGVAAGPPSTATALAAAEAIAAAGCPSAAPANIPAPDDATGSAYSTHLCLEPGGTVVLTDDSPAALNPSAEWFMAVPMTVDGTPVLRVWELTTTPDLLALQDAPLYDPASPANPGAAPGGRSLGWTLVGDVNLPSTGVVAARSADLQVGWCASTDTTQMTCPQSDYVGSGEAVAMPEAVTFVTGDTSEGNNLWVGAPPAGGNLLSLVAFGDVIYPWWGHAAGTGPTEDLTWPGRVLALGRTGNWVGTAPIDLFPAYQTGSGYPDYDVELQGSFAAPVIELTAGVASPRARTVTSTKGTGAQAPQEPWFSGEWRITSSAKIPTSDACGGPCADWLHQAP